MDTTRKTLLQRIKEHQDSEAWREFDAIYRPMLYRFARACRLSDADAEDVAQHCMTAVHRHIHSYEYDPDKGRFRGWLRTLANNRVRNILRDRREQHAETKDLKRPQQREQEPEQLFEEVWMDEHLRYCMKQVQAEVEPRTYQAFQRYVLDDQPVDQVCRELEMNPSQLYRIKWRITQKLSEHMKELLGDDE